VLDLEVVSVFRKAFQGGALTRRRAGLALADLINLDLVRVNHRRMLTRIWEIRQNITPYDAAYVALAETINATLVTADKRLSLAPGPRCTIEYLGS
jgi:predicted nucleic acid-binding protein